MDRNALVVNGLTKRYQDFTLDGVSFTVPQGSIVGLIGENGAGKSTTLHAVLGLIGRDGGTVELLGLPDDTLDDQVRNQIGVVFDGNSYPEMLTPRKLGRVMGKIYRTWDPDRYAALLQQLALPADKRIKALSKGMKMKLALAVAFSHHAKLLVLDEATSGLDPADMVACRRQDYEWEVLVADRDAARRKYPKAVVDPATMDEIMLLYVKGERR